MKEISSLYKFRWPSLDVFENRLVWHGYFTSPISQDMDLKFLQHDTREGIRLEVSSLLDWALALATACTHEEMIKKFCISDPVYQVFGMIKIKIFFFLNILFCVFFLDRPDYQHVPAEVPRSSKLVKEMGEVRVYALQQRPDILCKMWLKQSNDVQVQALCIRIALMERSVFKIEIEGPEDNIVQISWSEKDAAPVVSDEELLEMRLVIANTSGGDKTLSFLLEGMKPRQNVPPIVKCVHGSSYQIIIPTLQLFGGQNDPSSSLRLNTGMSSANALISDKEKSK